MSDQIRADYEKLEDIATRFKGQSAATFEMMKQTLDVAGAVYHEWMGKGSDAFYHEMEEVVVPGLKRLVAALDEAGNVALEIVEVLKEAEEEASSPFRGGEAAPSVTGGVAGGEGEGTAVSGSEATTSSDSSPETGTQNPIFGLRERLVQKAFQLRNIARGLLDTKSGSGLLNTFGKTFKGIGRVAPILGTVIGFSDIGTELGVRVKQNGEDFASALSHEAGEGTAEILTRLALYSNPFTGIPTFAHDIGNALGIIDTDIIEEGAQFVGRGANAASDFFADGAVAIFNNPEIDVQVDFPRTTIRDFERAGQPIPRDVAQRLFFGLLQNEGSEAANGFINDFAAENNVTIMRGIGGLPIGFLDK